MKVRPAPKAFGTIAQLRRSAGFEQLLGSLRKSSDCSALSARFEREARAGLAAVGASCATSSARSAFRRRA
jgi:hypothetical protein